MGGEGRGDGMVGREEGGREEGGRIDGGEGKGGRGGERNMRFEFGDMKAG